MLNKSHLSTIIADQMEEITRSDHIVTRSIYSTVLNYEGNSALVIKGIRRCGKSTLLKQLILGKGSLSFFYFNFDDERIYGFSVEDFQTLMETFIETYGQAKNIFFDEIQNVNGWELFVNRLLREGNKVFVTGSNSNLLSKELGTHLTGRHVDLELYPFSFSEYLSSRGIEYPLRGPLTTIQRAEIMREFKNYYLYGGMPEVVISRSDLSILQLTSDIIQKDIMVRYGIRHPQELRKLLNFILGATSSEMTSRSLSRSLQIKSEKTVGKYVEYLEDAYLIFEVRRYDPKLKNISRNPRKYYSIDNGITLKNLPSFIEKKGALLENLVALDLKRVGKEFYYYKNANGAEVDFIIPIDGTMIHVCYELNFSNREREVNGFVKARNELKANAFIILTMDQEYAISMDNFVIEVQPVWKWLLNKGMIKQDGKQFP